MKFKPYPKYKASGVEWLGDVPNEWTVKALKYIGWFKGGAGFPHEDQGVQGQAIPFFKVKHLEGASRTGHISDHEHTISEETANRLGANIFPENTIVFAKVGAALLLGRIRFLGLRSCIDNNMMGFQLLHPDAVPRFIWYSMSRIRFDEIANPGAVPSLNEGQISTQLICFPDRAEQSTIATFLDHETAKIDTLIAKQEKLIDLLKEKRQAVIFHAVTKGLDPTVPMKPSGVEWLGDVPTGWTVRKLAQVIETIGSGTTPKSDVSEYYENGEIPWLNTGDLNDAELHSCNKSISKTALETHSSLKIYPAGAVVIAMYGATIGKLAKLHFSTTVNQACCVFLCGDIVHNNFLFYWLLGFREQIVSLATGGGQPNISQDVLRALRLACPDLSEQFAIATFLDSETLKIDTLIAKAQQAIALQKEHRTALISAAVTGKIDIREAVEH